MVDTADEEDHHKEEDSDEGVSEPKLDDTSSLRKRGKKTRTTKVATPSRRARNTTQ